MNRPLRWLRPLGLARSPPAGVAHTVHRSAEDPVDGQKTVFLTLWNNGR